MFYLESKHNTEWHRRNFNSVELYYSLCACVILLFDVQSRTAIKCPTVEESPSCNRSQLHKHFKLTVHIWYYIDGDAVSFQYYLFIYCGLEINVNCHISNGNMKNDILVEVYLSCIFIRQYFAFFDRSI